METPSISIRVGYARVSIHEQNLDVQKDAPELDLFAGIGKKPLYRLALAQWAG